MLRAPELLAVLKTRGETVATVESLTGGLLCASLTDVPGASQVVRGGVVAYTLDAKRDVVAVDPDILREHGAVSAQAATALADRILAIFGSTWAVSTTGVAGPAEQEGKPAGTVFIGLAGPHREVLALHLEGDRYDVRHQTCEAAVELLLRAVEYEREAVSLE
ncbi:MAG: CinA family protein [Actinobacteria bacterium]|nr:CinA family protein [Actinomycetota bacterium]MCB8995821.1 CinA family protein [Actinomycetota bacterium]MCB9415580.1 CinA family protein [Actinomycetota bacterium]HRY09344.1 CinA family protein [Candidatus Nanopelagicales bacterium]